jgi:cytochrome c peroxidase
VLAGALAGLPAPAAEPPGLPVAPLSAEEVRAVLRHGPWPPPAARDPGNRVSGDPAAAALGARLFFDPRLSASGATACATCHAPGAAWGDGRPRGVGHERLDRNTPSLWNVGFQRWLGWDGGSDSLWAQSIRPLLAPAEMAASPRHVAALLDGDPGLACLYDRAFGPGARAGRSEEARLADAGKALAAFQETLVTGATPFDTFREALARGDAGAAARYPEAARRGLRLFVGRGRCAVCHAGPAFTHGEFHDVGVPYFAAPGRVDPGRHGGIRRLLADPFNRLGAHSDDPAGRAALRTRHVALQPRNFGEFRVPGLRNVALTAPYMHDGRYATLRDVVEHYSTLDEERLHADGEAILRPLRLAPGEALDLVAFLETLTDPAPAWAAPPAPAGCPPAAGPAPPAP